MRRCRMPCEALAACLAYGLTAGAAGASQGPGVANGTAGPVAQGLAIAFIAALPLTLALIGLMRRP